LDILAIGTTMRLDTEHSCAARIKSPMAAHTPTLPPPALQAGFMDEVQAFVAVAQTGSFTAAASRLGKDGSTISRRIGSLEARLGVRLVERTTRRAALTEPGTAYLARMTAVLDQITDADAEISALGDVPQGLLRITAPRSYGRLWVAPLLPQFLARHPHVRIEVLYADHFVDLVGEGYDVAVRLGKLADSSLVARKVGIAKRGLVASAGYLKRHGVPKHPHDLAQHRCLGFAGMGRGSAWTLRKAGQRIEISVSSVLVADDAETLVAAAAEGAGIAVATDWMLDKHPQRKNLVPVLKGWAVGEEGAIHIVTPTVRFLPAKTKAFVEMAMERLRR
jgi:DNA-binding transcriptional LysR family regulator